MFGHPNFSKCHGVFWDKLVKESCPDCSAPFPAEKTTQLDGAVRNCQNEDCDYKMAVSKTEVTSPKKVCDNVAV